MSSIDVVVFKFREICPTGNQRNRALFTGQKIRLPLKLTTVATARIALKVYRDQPKKCTQSAPDFIQIGSFSAEL